MSTQKKECKLSVALAVVRRAQLFFMTALVVWFVNASVANADGAVIAEGDVWEDVSIAVINQVTDEVIDTVDGISWLPGDTVAYALRLAREVDSSFTYTTEYFSKYCSNMLKSVDDVWANDEDGCVECTYWSISVGGEYISSGMDTAVVPEGGEIQLKLESF
ncbi:MAG: hypothetical protein F6K14_01825 [Symploca sp. SIO2C1]|nr:hypothetical protein [Symploca sp. SIO2C1]